MNHRHRPKFVALLLAIIACCLSYGRDASAAEERVKILFLGDNGHHTPAKRFAQLEPALKSRGIDLTYTDKMDDLNPDTLKAYDGLMIYSNETKISPEQEKAMVDYVASGHGLIPIHCASYCFLNSPKYIAMVGGQFKTHKTGTFNTKIVDPAHPIMAGFKPFETWDETYVHTKVAKDIHVLQVRPESVDGGQGGDGEEPWTWVRNEGKGRVFYTAYGHDERTFGNPAFVDLIERGARWATRKDTAAAFDHPKMVGPSKDVKPFEYVTADGIPFYDPTGRGPRNGGGAWNKMQSPLDPAESMKHMQLPEGFEAKLFVAEPQVIKPLTMAWDERGRLWVVESTDYPNRVTQPGKGSDRIKICEDTDGDGIADKFTIFAEGLNIPFSLVFSNGGVIVNERTSTWFMKDTDGDGKADVKKEILTGWYPGGLDNHAGPNNLRYGLDNKIWGMVGYGAYRGTVNGKQLRFSQGFYRFDTDGSNLEFIRSTSNNTWGIGFSDEGIVFGSTANGCPSVYMPIANRYYESVGGSWSPGVLRMISPNFMFHAITDKVRQVDFHGGYTAAAGHALYTARAYPKEYWNRTAFVTEPTGHIVGTFILEPDGADFKSHNPFNLLASDDEWTAPIMAEVGPDGCVWVIDWYNYIVQHNPTPQGFQNGPGNAYVTPRRDKEHGRIYRIVYTGAKPYKPIDLSKASPQELVAALSNDNQLWRKHAQRLLVERQNKDVVADLIKLVADQSVDEIGLNVGAIHAMWTLKGLGALDGADQAALAAAASAMKHPSAGVRRNAVQVLPSSSQSLATLLASNALSDSDAQVRLQTLLAIADMPNGGPESDRTGAAIYAMLQKLENINDRWIPDAATAAAAKHDASFLRSVLAASAKNPDQPAAPPQKVELSKPAANQPTNLIQNPSMEDVADGKPANWRQSTFGGNGKFTLDATVAHSGTHSLKISSDNGGDIGWSQDIPVKLNTRYRLSAWVKTKGLAAGQSMGALFNLHQLQQSGLPKPLTGDNDWTLLTSEFATGGSTNLQLNMLFGGWGRAKGEAWWDDVELVELGPGGPIDLSSTSSGAAASDAKLANVIKLVTRHYAERAPADTIVATLESLKDANRQTAASVLDGLVAGWPSDAASAPKLTDADKAKIAEIGKALPADQLDRLLVLAGRWGQSQIFAGQLDDVLKTVKATLASASSSMGQRIDASQRLLRLSDTSVSIDAILAQINPRADSDLSRGLILSLADSRVDDAAKQVVASWNNFTPAARKAAVSVMLRRVPWTMTLLDAIQNKKLTRGDLAISDWQMLRLHKDKAISALAVKLDANQMDANRQKVLDKMLPAIANAGDAAIGKELFTKRCAQCHTFNGAGGKVGPELSGIGGKDPKEILADIVDPNRSVEANYRMWTIETKEGDSYSGRLDTETQTSVELLDATGEKHVIQRKEIESMNASALSVMPVGLIDDLKPEEIAALMQYLTKTVPVEKK